MRRFFIATTVCFATTGSNLDVLGDNHGPIKGETLPHYYCGSKLEKSRSYEVA